MFLQFQIDEDDSSFFSKFFNEIRLRNLQQQKRI